MEIIHLLVSMSLSGITLFLGTSTGLTDTLWTIATRHRVCINFVQLFYWKKPCQDSWWHTSVLSWISTADQGVTHFPLFLFLPLFKAWEKKDHVQLSLLNTTTQHLHLLPSYSGLQHMKSRVGLNQASGLNNFYSGILLVCCCEQWRNFLVRFCLMIMGFPLPLLPWGWKQAETHRHSWRQRDVRNERKWGLIPVWVLK